jgi:serine/threonine-protein kinase RsbT
MSERRENASADRDEGDVEGDVYDAGTVRIASEDDILRARQRVRAVAEEMEFRLTDVTRIVTAVSELARNIHLYAGEGEMHWTAVQQSRREGLELVFDDNGPGIEDVEAALQGNHSTSNGMGRGLSGTRKLVDEFDIETGDDGTTVTIRKWKT